MQLTGHICNHKKYFFKTLDNRRQRWYNTIRRQDDDKLNTIQEVEGAKIIRYGVKSGDVRATRVQPMGMESVRGATAAAYAPEHKANDNIKAVKKFLRVKFIIKNLPVKNFYF